MEREPRPRDAGTPTRVEDGVSTTTPCGAAAAARSVVGETRNGFG